MIVTECQPVASISGYMQTDPIDPDATYTIKAVDKKTGATVTFFEIKPVIDGDVWTLSSDNAGGCIKNARP